MYLHLGNGKYVKKKDIVAVFDMDTATVCVATRRFLSEKEKVGKVTSADGELPKSFMILSDKTASNRGRARRHKPIKEEREEIILSKFSSGVLYGRTSLSAMTVETLTAEAPLTDNG